MVISYLLSFGYRGIIWHVKDLRLLNSSRLFAWRAGLSCCTCTSALHAMTGMHQPLTIAIPASALQPCCASSQMLSLRCNCFIRLLLTLSTPAGTFFCVCFLLFFCCCAALPFTYAQWCASHSWGWDCQWWLLFLTACAPRIYLPCPQRFTVSLERAESARLLPGTAGVIKLQSWLWSLLLHSAILHPQACWRWSCVLFKILFPFSSFPSPCYSPWSASFWASNPSHSKSLCVNSLWHWDP